jgi:hypothetical protein
MDCQRLYVLVAGRASKPEHPPPNPCTLLPRVTFDRCHRRGMDVAVLALAYWTPRVINLRLLSRLLTCSATPTALSGRVTSPLLCCEQMLFLDIST